jgi:hypothetical protein
VILANLTIDGAVTAAVTSPVQLQSDHPESLLLQGNFTYGSGGTTVNAWVQTSVDGATTWIDIANFSFTTTSGRQVYNLSGLTSQLTAIVPKDGTLTTPAQDGILGSLFRVKYTTTGVYAGGTTLRIDATTRGPMFSKPYALNL